MPIGDTPPASYGHQNGRLLPTVVQRLRRQSVQPEEGASTQPTANTAVKFEVELAAVDLEECTAPGSRLISQAIARRDHHDPYLKPRGQGPAEQVEPLDAADRLGHCSSSESIHVGGSPNAGNVRASKVVISISRPFSMRSTSSVVAMKSDSPQART